MVSTMNGAEKIVEGPYGWALWILSTILGIFSVCLHRMSLAPWLYFLAFIFYIRTAALGDLAFFIFTFASVLISNISFFWVHPIFFLNGALLAAGTTALAFADRYAFRKFLNWSFSDLEKPGAVYSKMTITGKSLYCFRLTVCMVIFPLLYPSMFFIQDFLPSPLNASGFSNIGLSAYGTGIQMLAAVGGVPLISFTMALFGSLVSALLIACRIDHKGSREDVASLGTPAIEVYGAMSTASYTDSSPTLLYAGSPPLSPWSKTASAMRRSLVPVWVLLGTLVLTAEVIPVLFGPGAWRVEFDTLKESTRNLRVACVPGPPSDTGDVRRLAEESIHTGVQLVMTSEGFPMFMSNGEMGSLANDTGVVIGMANTLNKKNGFTLMAPNNRILFTHYKRHQIPFEFITEGSVGVSVAEHEFTDIYPPSPEKAGDDDSKDNTEGTTDQAEPKDEPRKAAGRKGTPGATEMAAKVLDAPEPTDTDDDDVPPKPTTEGKDLTEGKPSTEGKDLTEGKPSNGELSHSESFPVILGGAICFDMYFANDIAAAGRQHVDTILVPSMGVGGRMHDGHVSVMGMRAIENGASVVLCQANGINGVYGPFGGVHSQHFTDKGPFIFDVPIAAKNQTSSFFRLFPTIGGKLGFLMCFSGLACAILGVFAA